MNSTSKFAKYFYKSINEDVGTGAFGDGPSTHMRNVNDEGGGKQYTNTPGDARLAKPLGKKKKGVQKRMFPENEESNIKFSVGSVGGQHGQIMHTDKTFDSLEDACNHAGVDVQDCISGEWDDMGDGTKEYGVDEDTVIVMHVDKAEDEENNEVKQKFSKKYADKVEKEFAKHVKLRSPDGKLGVKLPPGNKKEIEDYKKKGYKEEEAEDRCKRKADSVYGKKTSAYKSGAIVRCRKGKIWKKK